MSVVYGARPVLEALRSGRRRVRRLWIAAGAAGPAVDELAAAAASAGVEVHRVGKDEIQRRAGTASHQGAVADADPLPSPDLDAVLEAAGADGLLIALDGVQDPQNLGAILRAADCAGAAAVVIPRDRAVGMTPVVIKVAAGAAEHVPVVVVANLRQALERAKRRGSWVVGLEPGAESAWCDLDLRRGTTLVLGAEGRGLRPLVRRTCDFLAAIPVQGRIPSLNVAAAAAVVLFEAVRQRRAAPAASRAGRQGRPGSGA